MFLFFSVAGISQAQFQVYTWENFEKGRFPENLKWSHNAREQNVNVFDYSSVSTLPGIQEAPAPTECGNFGLRFDTIGGADEILKVVSNVTLDRKNLGVSGKSLYQADIFIPQNNANFPYTVAILAELSDPANPEIYSFYRLGVVKGERVFFSYTNKTYEPIIYLQTFFTDLKLKIPGWHRLQIIFEGQEDIICAIDGRPLPFSPIKESTLDKLHAGFMCSSSSELASPKGFCFVDNLSIQWTTENLALPDSPWTYSMAPEAKTEFINPLSPIMVQSQLNWLSSPEDAWQESVTKKQPLLTLFYAPHVKAYLNLEQFINGNTSAQNLIKQFVLLRIDINQLRGGTLAQHFNVNKVPCLMVIAPDQNVKTKEYYRTESDWPAIAQNLPKSLTP
jgi:hypothetical protein